MGNLSMLTVLGLGLVAAPTWAGGQATTGTPARATFDFTPPSKVDPGSAGVVIALLAPQYPKEAFWAEIAPDFIKNMALDFEEMLTARGFRLRGPFALREHMVYSDKTGADVTLTPVLEVKLDFGTLDVEKKHKFRLIGESGDVYKIRQGQVTLGGRVTLIAEESLTGERLWSFSVDLPARSTTFRGKREYARRPPPVSADEPELRAALEQLMQEVYVLIMQHCWDQLEPGQFQLFKKQADEIKRRAGYVAP